MPPVTKPSSAPGFALFYITAGTIMSIWSAVWYLMSPPESTVGKIICTGLFLTGMALLIIGFAMGRIGRGAREMELPPQDDSLVAAQPVRNA